MRSKAGDQERPFQVRPAQHAEWNMHTLGTTMAWVVQRNQLASLSTAHSHVTTEEGEGRGREHGPCTERNIYKCISQFKKLPTLQPLVWPPLLPGICSASAAASSTMGSGSNGVGKCACVCVRACVCACHVVGDRHVHLPFDAHSLLRQVCHTCDCLFCDQCTAP